MFTIIIVLLMAAGMLLGGFVFSRLESVRPLAAVERIQKAATFALLFAMGVWLGGNRSFWEQIKTVGLRGILFAVVSVACSVAGAWLVSALIFGPRRKGKRLSARKAEDNKREACSPDTKMLGPVLFLLAGIACGRVIGFPLARVTDPVITFSLGTFVFCAGIDIGEKRIVFRKLREYGIKILLFPLAIALGSVLGGLFLGMCLGMPARESAAITAGLGYYSLSSGILTELGGAGLGSLSFAVNVMREVLALLFIPLIARSFGFHAAIAPAGAASMDTALGVIARCTDEETALISMLNGVVLTIAVPVLVPLLYQTL